FISKIEEKKKKRNTNCNKIIKWLHQRHNLHKRKMVEDFGNMCKVPARNFQTAINIALTKDIQVEENASKWVNMSII
ncbi:hypothetical protein HID58_080733, partial [Brassica napus]